MSFSARCVRGAVNALNTGGRALHRLGADPPSLELEDLRRAAERRAGASALGAWPIEEPLARLLDSYRREADLTTLGRITVRELLVSLLENLLRLEAERAANPLVERQAIGDPVFIVGLPRTGTTHLHNLMSADPALRSLAYWESLEPVLAEPATDPDPRIERTAQGLQMVETFMPAFKRMHEMTVDHAHEEIQLLAVAGSTMLFET